MSAKGSVLDNRKCRPRRNACVKAKNVQKGNASIQDIDSSAYFSSFKIDTSHYHLHSFSFPKVNPNISQKAAKGL